jgi:hypothetical protein
MNDFPNLSRYLEVLEREGDPAELRLSMSQLTYVVQLCDGATGMILLCPRGQHLMSTAGSSIVSAIESLDVMCKIE